MEGRLTRLKLEMSKIFSDYTFPTSSDSIFTIYVIFFKLSIRKSLLRRKPVSSSGNFYYRKQFPA